MKLNFKKNEIPSFVGVIIYKILLDYLYINSIQSNENYLGFYLDIDTIKVLESYILLVVLFIILPKSTKRISSYIMKLQYLLVYIPMLSLYSLEGNSRIYMYMITSAYVIMFIFFNKTINLNIKYSKINKKAFYLFLTLIILATIVGLIKSGLMPNISVFDFKNIYEIRGDIKLDTLTSYTIGFTTRIIIPFLICSNYLKKKYKNMAIFIILQIIIYSMYPLKSILFAPILILVVIKVLDKDKFLPLIILAINTTLILGILLYNIFDNDIIINLLARRALFVPANIQFDYYDFFTKNRYLYMSNNLIGNMLNIDYPYYRPIVKIIGDLYYGVYDMSANTGFLAEAYAQVGYIGILIYTNIFIVINIFIDNIGFVLDKKIILPTLIFSIYALNDSSLLTTLSTHGLLIGIIILYFYSYIYKINRNIN